jgi:hypothetical protein
MTWRRSRTATERPARARYAAAVRPLWPAPMTNASHFLSFNALVALAVLVVLKLLRHILLVSTKWRFRESILVGVKCLLINLINNFKI